MANVILLCGKLCCGKSTYCSKLASDHNAMVLSCDELMLALLPPQLGHLHEEVSERAQQYLFQQAERLLQLGVNVILDWGFWQKESRSMAEDFFRSRGFLTEWHYLKVTDEEWQRRIAKRNREAPPGTYHIDQNLQQKCSRLFEEPTAQENLSRFYTIS